MASRGAALCAPLLGEKILRRIIQRIRASD
jgi:hypothetical protein